ncbi:MAG: phosphohistidine phosphatase SixA [Thermoplasmata archaeon]
MKLYLARHADPKSEAEDPERPLSERGERQAEEIGRFASNTGVRVTQIRHSGKKRAQQTAETMGRYLSPPGGVIPVSGIAPLDDVAGAAEKLEGEEADLMLVGHLPFMNRLVSQLLFGNPDWLVVDLPKAGMICLARAGDSWTIDWLVHPGILR